MLDMLRSYDTWPFPTRPTRRRSDPRSVSSPILARRPIPIRIPPAALDLERAGTRRTGFRFRDHHDASNPYLPAPRTRPCHTTHRAAAACSGEPSPIRHHSPLPSHPKMPSRTTVFLFPIPFPLQAFFFGTYRHPSRQSTSPVCLSLPRMH